MNTDKWCKMYKVLENKSISSFLYNTLSLNYHLFLFYNKQCLARTLKAHDAAHDHNVPRTPLLHVGHHFFDHADHTKEVGLKHLFHLLDADAFNWSQQAHTCIIDYQETNLLFSTALLPLLRWITDVTTRCQSVTTTERLWQNWSTVKAVWVRGHQPSPGGGALVQQGFLSYQVGSCCHLGS